MRSENILKKKKPTKHNSVKKSIKASKSSKPTLDKLDKKINIILEKHKKLENSLKTINRKINTLKKEDDTEIDNTNFVYKLEKKQINELDNLEMLERKVEEEVKVSPLVKITYRDFIKGTIGAFFGIIGHFAFVEGLHLAETMSMLRASILYVVAFFLGLLILYYSGFRKVNSKKILKILPLRLITIYSVAIIDILAVLIMFGELSFFSPFGEVYKKVASIIVLAVLGAGTADLIGKE